MNYVLQHKLGFAYKWKIRIWGDIFNLENDKKFLKEIVANGNLALLPKLMSAEGMSILDTQAVVNYITTLDFYKDFVTYTQLKNADLAVKAQKTQADLDEQANGAEGNGVGRPRISDDDLENENTEKARQNGTEGSEGRETSS